MGRNRVENILRLRTRLSKLWAVREILKRAAKGGCMVIKHGIGGPRIVESICTALDIFAVSFSNFPAEQPSLSLCLSLSLSLSVCVSLSLYFFLRQRHWPRQRRANMCLETSRDETRVSKLHPPIYLVCV